jgi:hypothetical protein
MPKLLLTRAKIKDMGAGNVVNVTDPGNLHEAV